MHVRITTVRGATNIDGGIAYLREEAVPQVKQQKGFRGLSASGDRSSGIVTILTQWESEADLDASESTAEKARNDTLRILGGTATVDRFEQSVWEVGDVPPGLGATLHIRRIKMDPARIDDNLAFFTENVVSDIKATPGFLGLRHLINRSTGEGRVGTLWADQSSLETALSKAEQRRSTAADRGVAFGDETVLEVLYSAM
jgi:heme-degrading monooxygenase HmoA